jgi:hypothetical protein
MAGEGQAVEQKPQEAQLQHPHAEHLEAERSPSAIGRAGEQAVERMPGASDGPPLDFDIPPVIDTTKFPDPGSRNIAINASYHQFDKSLTRYLGQPYVANWATFGKHASAHVGNEMAGAQESLRLIDSLGSVERLVADVENGNLFAAMKELNSCMEAVNKLETLVNKKGVVAQSAGMAIHFLKDTLHRIKGALTTPDPNPLHKVQHAVAELKGLLPRARGEIQTMFDQLADGNQKIYDNVAPGLQQFLQQVQTAKGGITQVTVKGDDGFFGAAFKHWVEARKLTNDLSDPAKAGEKDLLAKRLAEVKQGNMILVTHEQMIAQPDYDRMQPQMKALGGTMVLVDPDGAHKLLPNGGNWGDFHERLGYDKAKSPDMKHVDPNALPPLVDKTDPRYAGTIAEYFDDNATNKDLAQAPSTPHF